MSYDNGEVLIGLNESWTFMGAKAMEWAVGMVVFLIIGSFAKPGQAMPLMIGGWILTTTSLASMRKSFPDEERGVRNALTSAFGFTPPDIPSPAILQPVWSGCPAKSVPANSRFVKLGFDKLFPSFEYPLLEADEEVVAIDE